MRSPHGVMTTRDVAGVLGVSVARVNQLVAEGKLPPPTELGPRAYVWQPADVDALRLAGEGQAVTFSSALVASAQQPLVRRYDVFMDYPTASDLSRAHIRVWEGPAAEGQRIVVLVGALEDHPVGIVNFIADIADLVDAVLLEGRGGHAIWFDYFPNAFRMDDDHQVDNVILTVTSSRSESKGISLRTRRTSAASPDRGFTRPGWSRASIAEVERVIGLPVECYPVGAYTESTIERWQRAGRQIAVEHDEAQLRPLLEALAFMDNVPATDGHARLASETCPELAQEVRLRLQVMEARVWEDGTRPPTYHVVERPWPQLFAARLVPLTLSPRDEERLQHYPDHTPWPWSPEEFGRRRKLRAELRTWLIDCGEYGDKPEPSVHQAVEWAAGSLAYWLNVADPTFRESDHPDSAPRSFDVVGECDRHYLASVRWNATTRDSPTHRELRAKFSSDVQSRLEFGLDPWLRLVARDTGNERSRKRFAVDWPLRPPGSIPDEALIVADGGLGSRPVYIQLPDGKLDPLPRQPDPIANDWNFGYGGGGPGSLESAILRTIHLADGVPIEDLPHAWVDDQVCHSDKAHLRISVRDLRRRVRLDRPSRSTEESE
jgi:predicted DNA-binding transcriptional regulator AlpA